MRLQLIRYRLPHQPSTRIFQNKNTSPNAELNLLQIFVGNWASAVFKAEAHGVAFDDVQFGQRIRGYEPVKERKRRLERSPVPRAVNGHFRAAQVRQFGPHVGIASSQNVA